MTGARAARLEKLQGIYALCGATPGDPAAQARAAIAGGAGAVQLRMKGAASGAVLAKARALKTLAAGRALVFVNDRPDLAALADVDGVHLGAEDLPVAAARAVVGPDRLVGRTARDLAEAEEALRDGADYVGFGPVFPSRTKHLGVAPRGLDGLAALCAGLAATGARVVAIGGIALEQVGEVARAGADAAAVAEALYGRGDASENAAALAAAFLHGARGA